MKFSEQKSNNKIMPGTFTSLIDVMFLLVIFLLVASRFEKDSGIQVNLPKGASTLGENDSKPIELSILKDGTLYIGNDQLTLDDLKTQLETIPKTTTIRLRCDREAMFQYPAEVMNILKQTEHLRIDFQYSFSGTQQ